MFTGLVEEIGTLKSFINGAAAKVTVSSEKIVHDVQIGDSVAVNGVCLTVTSIGDKQLTFDAVQETLARSTLGSLQPGDRVNLEASLRAGKMIGGHFVQGHVDGVGTIESVRRLGHSAEIRIAAGREIVRYVVEKGSVTIDGTSLTVANVDDAGFTIAVIPHTLEVTTLGLKRPGDRVNIEVDIIGKYVEKFLGARGQGSGVTEDLLRNSGFM